MPAQHALELFLGRLLSHSVLSEDEKSAILALPRSVYEASQFADISPRVSQARHVRLVACGVIAQASQLRDGRRQFTALYWPGDICDLQTLVVSQATWTLQPLVQSTIVAIPIDDLRRLARRYPSIGMALWRDGAVDASVMSQWMVNVARKTAHMRLAHFLCETAIRLERAHIGNRAAFSIVISQEHLADVLGLTAVHVNRVIRSLHRGSVISMKARRVEILDWKALARLGEFDPAYLHLDPLVDQ